MEFILKRKKERCIIMSKYFKRFNKKILFTTVPVTSVSVVNQVPGQIINIESIDNIEDYILLANNESFQSGKIQPAIGLHFLKKNLPYIDILEYPTWKQYEDALKCNYDIVAIGFYTLNFYDAVKMAQMARNYGVKEVWAGNYGALTPGVTKYFDRSLLGYPEKKLKLNFENKEMRSIKHPILTTPFRTLNTDERAGYLVTVRGCKYKCQFCSTSHFSSSIEKIDTDEIERVLNIYRDMGVNYIILFDQTFLLERNHARDIINLLHKKKMKWFCTTRADLLLGNVRDLKEKGLDGVYIGIESMNNKNLIEHNKGETAEKILNAITELTHNEISVSGTYILGLLNDTKESIKIDLEKVSKLPLYVLIFLVLTPYPELPLYKFLKDRGLIINEDWCAYDGMNLVFRHPHMSVEDVRELFEYAVCNIYSPYNYNKRRVLQRMKRYKDRSIAIK